MRGRATIVTTVTVANTEAPRDITKYRSKTEAPCFEGKEGLILSGNNVLIELTYSDWNYNGIGPKKQVYFNIRPEDIFCVSCLFVLCFLTLLFCQCSLQKLNIKRNKVQHIRQRALAAAVDQFTFYIYICICSWAKSHFFFVEALTLRTHLICTYKTHTAPAEFSHFYAVTILQLSMFPFLRKTCTNIYF